MCYCRVIRFFLSVKSFTCTAFFILYLSGCLLYSYFGVTINTLATLTQFYRMPLPMLISYRGELREPVSCQVEMAVHTKALLNQMLIPTYHFHKEKDAEELPEILKYTFMCNKPVAILTDASFWGGYGDQ